MFNIDHTWDPSNFIFEDTISQLTDLKSLF